MDQWDFSGDEWLFFVAALITGLFFAWRWYRAVCLRSPLRRCPGIRLSLAASPILALLATAFIIDRWADPKTVAGHLDYEFLFIVGGAAWIFTTLAITMDASLSEVQIAVREHAVPKCPKGKRVK